jgi:SAM-dependent methyltransferase
MLRDRRDIPKPIGQRQKGLSVYKGKFNGELYRIYRGEISLFDIVVFSYNGIDYVPHDDRLRVLSEIRRVLRHGGTFAFSTHNILCASRFFFYFPHPWSFRKLAILSNVGRLGRIFRRRALNPGFRSLLNQEYAVFVDNDCTDQFRLKTYYINPHYQINQLRASGFENVRIFSLAGTEIWSTN